MKKFLPLIVGMLIAAVGVGAYFMLFNKSGAAQTPRQAAVAAQAAAKAEHAARIKNPMEGPVVGTGDTFTVNLKDKGSFVRTDVAIQVDDKTPLSAPEAEGATGPILLEENPQIRDLIIDVLNAHSSDEVTTPAGREELKKAIVTAINEHTHHTVVMDVYFQTFAVQSGV